MVGAWAARMKGAKPMKRSTFIQSVQGGVVALAAAVAATGPSAAQGTMWQAGTGDWFDPNNWSAGVPTASGIPFVDNGGTALIAAGDAVACTLILGLSSNGNVQHTGGTNTITDRLRMGRFEGASGAYELSPAGSLSAARELVGEVGAGAFRQSGGINTTAELFIGYEAAASGTYEMTSGQLLVADDDPETRVALTLRVGWFGHGEFRQHGGIVDVQKNLALAVAAQAVGAYELSNGTLNVGDRTIVGSYGRASFCQRGGVHTTERLLVSDAGTGRGTYELVDGEIHAIEQDIGRLGTGVFLQSGGLNDLATNLKVGAHPEGTGRYDISGGTLRVAGAMTSGYHDADTAVFVLSGSGHLEVHDAIYSKGRFEWLGGTIDTPQMQADHLAMGFDFDVAALLSGALFQNGGTLRWHRERALEITGGAIATHSNCGVSLGRVSVGSQGEGTYRMVAGALEAESIEVGSQGTLEIASALAHIEVTEVLSFERGAKLLAAPGATIHMTGADLENESIEPAALAGLNHLTLIFEGGPADVDGVEVAGKDLGPAMEGLDLNFALDTLQLGGAGGIGQVRLRDACVNQPDWLEGEALYVQNLIIAPESHLDLNGLNLYYLYADIDPDAVIDYNGGNLIWIPEPGMLALLAAAALAMLARRASPRAGED